MKNIIFAITSVVAIIISYPLTVIALAWKLADKKCEPIIDWVKNLKSN